MDSILYIFVGGGFGALCRYGLGHTSMLLSGQGYWGTLIATVAGGTLMGIIMGWLSSRSDFPQPVQLGITVGFLGGLTTFSTFSFEVIEFIRLGQLGAALLYALGSLLVCLTLCWVGFRIFSSGILG